MTNTKSNWRWFPAAVLLALASVCAVNGTMIYFAYHSHPGAAGTAGYDLGKVYDRVLQEASRQNALGWHVGTEADQLGHPVLRVTGRDGAPLEVAAVAVTAQRPVGPADAQSLTFERAPDGSLRAQDVLAPGQWTLMVGIVRGEDRMSTTERIVVR